MKVETAVCGTLRMKFMGAEGFASARGKRPAVEVAERGKGGCGWMFTRRCSAVAAGCG